MKTHRQIRHANTFGSRVSQRGTSLMETLVSLFVLAIGILGILAMQAKSMQYNQSAHTYSQAIYLANDLAERIRTNRTSAATYGTLAIPAANAAAPNVNCTTPGTACTPDQMATWDAWAWSRQLYTNLPASEADISNAEPGYLEIALTFDDTRAEEQAVVANGAVRKTYHLLVEI